MPGTDQGLASCMAEQSPDYSSPAPGSTELSHLLEILPKNSNSSRIPRYPINQGTREQYSSTGISSFICPLLTCQSLTRIVGTEGPSLKFTMTPKHMLRALRKSVEGETSSWKSSTMPRGNLRPAVPGREKLSRLHQPCWVPSSLLPQVPAHPLIIGHVPELS